MDLLRRSIEQDLAGIGAIDPRDNINHYYNSEMKEHMFDKVLTPSDVGKLNRLVIPKTHAENYFPLDETSNGTTLEFQDKNGMVWRFRYSYWNSSQSYVMTKGWSRFVKEKKLNAGDTVSFHRGYIPDDNEPEKRLKVMFVDWRHRSNVNLGHNMNHHNFVYGSPAYPPGIYYPVTEYSMPRYRINPPVYHNQFQEREYLGYGYGRNFNGGRYYSGSPLDQHHNWNLNRSEPLVYNSFPVYPAASVSPTAIPQPLERTSTVKKLRLFGVDVEESSSSGETRGEMIAAGYTSSSPVVIRDEESSERPPRGEIGASSSSVMQLSDNEEYRRKGKSLEF